MSAEIPFIRPSFPAAEDLAADVKAISDANWYTNFGPMERQFSAVLAGYVGRGVTASTCSNGTIGLLAAVHAVLGQGDGSRFLLLPSFTFVATAQAAQWCGYRPLFCDLDPTTIQPSVEDAASLIEAHGQRVAGILVCNTFGVGNSQIGQWEALAESHGLPLLIDSAAGFGSDYVDGEPVGARGACEIFSFHATKPMGIGEGGAVLSRSPRIVEAVHEFQNFGFTDGRDSTHLGLNGKLSEFHAAVGLRQLESLDARIASRRRVLARYASALESLGLDFQDNADRSSVCFAGAVCRSSDHKVAVLASLRANGVQARDYYNPPVHRQTHYAQNPEIWASSELAVTLDVCARIVSLPVHDFMPDADVDRVVLAISGLPAA